MTIGKEVGGNQDPTKPLDPELTLSQQNLKNLVDEILALKPNNLDSPSWSVSADVFPVEIQQILRESSLGDLLLNDGDSLSASTIDERRPDLNLFVSSSSLLSVGVMGWGYDYNKKRVNPDSTQPIIDYPGEKDWTRQLDITFAYGNNIHPTAIQNITAWTSSWSAGTLPLLSRTIWAGAYASQGYEGHKQFTRPTQNDEEVVDFVKLARLLFKSRIEIESI